MTAAAAAEARWVGDTGYRWLTAALAVCAVAFSVLPPGFQFKTDESVAGYGPLAGLQWPPLFAIGLWILWRRRRLAVAMLADLPLALPVILGWFLASTLWSVSPDQTLNRSLRLIGLMLIAWAYVLASWEPGRFWRQARWVLAIVAAGSIVATFVVPDIALHPGGDPEAGKWRGLTSHKNTLGVLGALGFVLWLHAWACREVRFRTALPCMLACAVALIGARSSSPVLIVAICSALALLFERFPVDLRGRAVPVLAGLLLVVVLPLHLYQVWAGSLQFADLAGPVAGLVGKDLTLTGRAALWRYLLDEIPNHPWIGLGHGAYWLGELSLSARAARDLYWTPYQGHNFYLDLVNETGFIGLALFLVLVARWLRLIAAVGAVDRSLAVRNGVLLLFLLLHGITETAMLRPITLPAVLMTFAMFDLGRRRFAAGLQARRDVSEPAGSRPAAR